MASGSASSIRTLAMRSAAWYGATRLWGQLISWLVTLLLARLLLPQDYGLFAMALSVLALLELLQEFGLGTALIQRQALTREQINSVFWVVATASLVLTTGTFLAAGTIASVYGEPNLAWPLRMLSLTFLLNSLSMVPYSLLTKAIDLRRRSLAEACGTTASALVALTLAWMGWGVAALVLGHLARALVICVLMTVFSGWFPGLAFEREGLRSLLGFGLKVAGSHLVGTGSTSLGTFVMARMLSSAAVGLYSMAESLTDAPHRLSTAVINQISLPVFAKLQSDQESLAAHFLKITKVLCVVSLPMQVGLALVAPDLIPLLLSPSWAPMILPFQVLCLQSTMVLSTITCSPLLTARGRATLLFGLSIASFACLVGGIFVGGLFGLVGVAVARLTTTLPLRLTMLVQTLREVDVPLGTFLRTLSAPAGACAVMAAVVLTIQHAGMLWGGRLEVVVASIAGGAAAYTVALFLLDRTLVPDLKLMARDLRGTSAA
jgi:O-antigen/teichoic acid export membrane protein